MILEKKNTLVGQLCDCCYKNIFHIIYRNPKYNVSIIPGVIAHCDEHDFDTCVNCQQVSTASKSTSNIQAPFALDSSQVRLSVTQQFSLKLVSCLAPDLIAGNYALSPQSVISLLILMLMADDSELSAEITQTIGVSKHNVTSLAELFEFNYDKGGTSEFLQANYAFLSRQFSADPQYTTSLAEAGFPFTLHSYTEGDQQDIKQSCCTSKPRVQ